jgi:ribonuclease BN (tRNA processing enzyme)
MSRGFLEALVNIPYTIPLEQLPYKARVLSIPGEVETVPFSLDWRYLRHFVPTLGFRVSTDDKVIVYCPDTGYCEEAVELAKGADLLIAECAYLPGEADESWPHLNPESAARLALEAGVKRLVLTHFDASRYLSMEDRIKAEEVAKAIFHDTLAARDDLVLEL